MTWVMLAPPSIRKSAAPLRALAGGEESGQVARARLQDALAMADHVALLPVYAASEAPDLIARGDGSTFSLSLVPGSSTI